MSTLKAINIALPGSYGLNTVEDTVPADAETASRFASSIWNAVVGVNGKTTSREDFKLQTTTGSGQVYVLHTVRTVANNLVIAGAKAGTTFYSSNGVTLTSSGTLAGLQEPQIATLGQYTMYAEAGVSAVIFSNNTWGVVTPSGQSWVKPNIVATGYGRMWVADDSSVSNQFTVWWSNLLDPLAWASGDAGSLDVTNAWPSGQDVVVAVALAFNRVLIFGQTSILMYTLGIDNDPGNMTLSDTIENIGCVARDSVVTTDEGVYFLAEQGLYRLDRLGQVTSLLTIPEMSKLYGEDLRTYKDAETASQIRAGYNPAEGWYLLTFPSSNVTVCVHTRKELPEPHAVPVTTFWNNAGMPFRAFAHDPITNNFYCGGSNGMYLYSGYVSDGGTLAYSMSVYTQWLNFGDDSRLKHLKGVSLVLEAASGQTGTLTWKKDYVNDSSRSVSFTCDSTEFSENPGIGTVRLAPLGDSCKVVKYGVDFPITSNAVTLHQLRPYANPGAIKF